VATPTSIPPDEATQIAIDVIGGGTPQVVSTVPPPPPGVTPQIDPTEIAEPEPPSGQGMRMYIDLDASEPGIQSTRDVNVGDTFKVGVVVTGAPPLTNSGGGISAMQFTIDYDKTKIVAPSIEGGPATDRNPDLNLPAFGGDPTQWFCLPPPVGDKDDDIPGGPLGDNNPATGQAYLACFSALASPASGTIVLGITTFVAAGTGSTTLSLSDVVFGDFVGVALATCDEIGDGTPIIPCADATVNVR
jgi:hypothetical protein